MRVRPPQCIFEVQPLEARALLTASPIPSSTIATPLVGVRTTVLGDLLYVQGTAGDDRITITNTSSGLRIADASGWSHLFTGRIAQIRMDGGAGNDRLEVSTTIRTDAILYGGAGVDTLVGGSGNDRLYGGEGRDYLYGRAGNDVLVALGDASVDRLYGGEGLDSFWVDPGSDELIIDASREEFAAGAVHRVGSFMSASIRETGATYAIPRTLGSTAPALPDPTFDASAQRYQNLSKYPLFSRFGPRADDVYQGSIGDCYLLASLGSIANTNPQAIRERVVDLGDGTFAVQFTSARANVYVRVDADLPVSSTGALVYAKLGRQGSLWVAIMEKAYAFFRSNQGSYGSLNGGFMGDVYEHLNLPSASLFSASSAATLLQRLQADLAAGMAVSLGTRPDVGSAPVTPAHAYMVDSVVSDSAGDITHLRLRNPWGFDDTPGHGADDGYILLTAAEAMRAFWFACSATVK